MKYSLKNISYLILLFSGFSFCQVTEDLLVNVHSVTTGEMNALTPESGCLAYNTDDTSLYVFNGSIWEKHKSDGSETKITAGDNVTVTGTGTTADPYIISTIKPTLTDNGDGTYTFSNGIDTDVTFAIAQNTPGPLISSSTAGEDCNAPAVGETSTFTITGENFTGDTTIDIPGQTVSFINVLSSTEITVNVTAGTTTGSFGITATNPNGSATFSNGYYVRDTAVATLLKASDFDIDNKMSIPSDGVILKTGTAGWDGNVNGKIPNGYIAADEAGTLSFVIDQTNNHLPIGLDATPSLTQSWNTIDYNYWLLSNGRRYIYENSTNRVVGANFTYITGDLMEIKKDCDGVVTYWQNGALVYTSPTIATSDLYLTTAFYNTGSQVSQVTITK